jgi:hypothetical protein
MRFMITNIRLHTYTKKTLVCYINTLTNLKVKYHKKGIAKQNIAAFYKPLFLPLTLKKTLIRQKPSKIYPFIKKIYI